ncbi:Vacuolar protein sorting-associated protein VTA1 [Candida viswanathii]|uniref:Vacuolar protein sorting-associated protein VTA1 n=1 Tax=Candida viswanathii TaxID=5486 RepID=A0A367YE83_9ASCO|nr:Vacuolar protein sorting-associated protein VTA1 [Candida viswanathii]
MAITTASIPEELKTNKSITPYIIRSIELAQANPVVSYYCKIYVLEHILTNKLHTTSKDVEVFTVSLLDDTESIKKDESDENLHKVLNDKQVSFGVVFAFAYKLFNSCLEGLLVLTKDSQAALVGKFKATLNFLNVLEVFKNSEIAWAEVTGGKADSWDEFDKLNKEKIKVLKYQLSRVLKGEVAYKDDEIKDEDLEKELDQELEELGGEVKDEEVLGDDEKEEDDKELGLPGAPSELPKFIDEENGEGHPELPLAPKFIDEPEDDDTVKLPGAPHVPPDVQGEEDDSVKFPGAPKYLPDDDLSHINKSSTIHVFSPSDKDKQQQPPAKKPDPPVRKPSSSATTQHKHHAPLTKENIKQILNRDDTITQVQKHAKFAQSALQFEDFKEAEKQLTQGLELLRVLRQQEDE